MSDVQAKILELFRKNEIDAGGVLPRQALVEGIRALNPDTDRLREAWHGLIVEGLVVQSEEGVELTRKGAYRLYEKSS